MNTWKLKTVEAKAGYVFLMLCMFMLSGCNGTTGTDSISECTACESCSLGECENCLKASKIAEYFDTAELIRGTVFYADGECTESVHADKLTEELEEIFDGVICNIAVTDSETAGDLRLGWDETTEKKWLVTTDEASYTVEYRSVGEYDITRADSADMYRLICEGNSCYEFSNVKETCGEECTECSAGKTQAANGESSGCFCGCGD